MNWSITGSVSGNVMNRSIGIDIPVSGDLAITGKRTLLPCRTRMCGLEHHQDTVGHFMVLIYVELQCLELLEATYAFWVNQCTSGFHGVNEPGVRVAREDDRGVTEGREDVREVFQQHRSGARRKLSRCGRDQMGNEPILALPEGANNFVVYYDARSKDLEACLEKRRRLSNQWLSMKKDVASCGSKYLAYSKVEDEYQGLQDCCYNLSYPSRSGK
ncbi:hypothetical protein Tco_1111549 [Tanacetum coccineum]|uniref:Uncharacterized protein n=1 Tax=Tanacetum coccineum TaxID=301880 RepID=A0ABQ5ILY1_9ASTR